MPVCYTGLEPQTSRPQAHAALSKAKPLPLTRASPTLALALTLTLTLTFTLTFTLTLLPDPHPQPDPQPLPHPHPHPHLAGIPGSTNGGNAGLPTPRPAGQFMAPTDLDVNLYDPNTGFGLFGKSTF